MIERLLESVLKRTRRARRGVGNRDVAASQRNVQKTEQRVFVALAFSVCYLMCLELSSTCGVNVIYSSSGA